VDAWADVDAVAGMVSDLLGRDAADRVIDGFDALGRALPAKNGATKNGARLWLFAYWREAMQIPNKQTLTLTRPRFLLPKSISFTNRAT
jgi:hypothetical protein